MQQLLYQHWKVPVQFKSATSPPGPPKRTELFDSQWEAEIPHTVKKIYIYKHTFTKELWDLNLGLSQNTANQSILDVLFNIQPPSNIPRKRRSVCWIYYSFTKWFFLTVIFSVNNNTGVWSSLWSRGSGSLASLFTVMLPLLMLPVQVIWE